MITACAAASLAFSAAAADRNVALKRLGNHYIASGQADGLSMAIIANGKVRFLNFGTTSQATAQPPTRHSVYEIGSVTKVFTSLLLAQAIVEGRVGLNDDIRQHLPGHYPNLEQQGVPVRLVHLAETTSGLPDNIPDLAPLLQQAGPDRAPFLIADRWKEYSTADLLSELRSVTLANTPGSVTRHSNVAAVVLAAILERTYGEPYEKLVARYIEVPFGMKAGSGNARAAKRVPGQNANRLTMPKIEGRYILPAGGLRYSSADLARFVQAQLNRQTAAVRLSQQGTGGGQPATLGFNWHIAPGTNGGRVLRASGSTFGSSSYVEVRPDEGCGLVLLTNRSGAESALYILAAAALQHGICSRLGPRQPTAPRASKADSTGAIR
jgi:CubicO group peptidase (beta-lactamase class C family)